MLSFKMKNVPFGENVSIVDCPSRHVVPSNRQGLSLHHRSQYSANLSLMHEVFLALVLPSATAAICYLSMWAKKPLL